jgi:hypothetical protein
MRVMPLLLRNVRVIKVLVEELPCQIGLGRAISLSMRLNRVTSARLWRPICETTSPGCKKGHATAAKTPCTAQQHLGKDGGGLTHP